MFCEDCGKKIKKNSEFCIYCGEKNKIKEIYKVDNIYKITGNFSIALGIIGFITGIFVGYKPENIISDIIVALIYNFPRIYFGQKIKNFNFKDLIYVLNISRWMLIYSIVIGILNFIIDRSGWLYWILIFLYFLSYKKTKFFLTNIKEQKFENRSI